MVYLFDHDIVYIYTPSYIRDFYKNIVHKHQVKTSKRMWTWRCDSYTMPRTSVYKHTWCRWYCCVY